MSGGIPACSCRRLFQAFQVLQAGCPHLERASMKNRNYKEQESGACRRSAAHLEAHHRPTTERHNHDTLRRACCSLAVRYSFESGVFQVANRLPRCILAKSPRGGAGNFRGEESAIPSRVLDSIAPTPRKFPAPPRADFATILIGKRFAP